MSKELDEAWTTICHYNDEIIHDMGSEYVENPLKEEIDIVNNALLELKAIKEANPSEALTEIFNIIYNLDCGTTYEQDKKLDECRKTIKQALLKAQEQEKVLEIIKEKRVIVDLLIDNNLEDYNNKIIIIYGYALSTGRLLTQEEFDLLKRWLG